MQLFFFKIKLKFKYPIRISKSLSYFKTSFFLKWENYGNIFLSECPYFKGLSLESEDLVVNKLDWLCNNFFLDQKEVFDNIKNISSLLFCYEQILYLFKTKNPYIYIPSKFTKSQDSIKVNGLIWSRKSYLIKNQIQEKIKQGYKCLKLKIGVEWNLELKVLEYLRNLFSEEELELRVDANEAFSFEEAKVVLEKLKILKIHSIEQPIKKNNWTNMSKLCKEELIPIALDEELIGIYEYSLKEELLKYICPKYLVLKPALIGGTKSTLEWIELCEKYNINWWITSSLESNIGLNFLSQFTYTLNSNMYHGLSTINLFKNNYYSPLHLKKDRLFFSINHIIKH